VSTPDEKAERGAQFVSFDVIRRGGGRARAKQLVAV
jgi:hypothetical protein